MVCVTDNVTYSSARFNHWDNLFQLNVLTFAHLKTESSYLFPQRNPDIYKCQVTKIFCRRSYLKDWANRKVSSAVISTKNG